MKESIKMFLDNDIKESEFYHISNEDLVDLRDYLEALKLLDHMFRYLTSEELTVIKRKLDWVESVSYNGVQNKDGKFFLESIHIFAKDNDEIIACRNKETGLYEGSIKNVPKLYLISPKVRTHIERQKELRKIQPELKEIESIGRNVYNDHLNRKESISGAFKISYAPGYGMLVSSDYELVAGFYDRKPKYKNKTYFDDKAKNKVLSIIQMYKHDLPTVEKPIVTFESVFPNEETEERVYKTLNMTLKNNKNN